MARGPPPGRVPAMIPMTTARRLGAASLAAVACAAAAALPSAASAAAPNVRSAPAVSKDALAAGRAQFGSRATPAQALSAYWTPERMRAARPVEDSPSFGAAAQHYARQVADGSVPQGTQAKRPPLIVPPAKGGTGGTGVKPDAL